MDHCCDKETVVQSAIRRMSLVLRPMTGKVGNRLKDQDAEHLICKPEENPNFILKVTYPIYLCLLFQTSKKKTRFKLLQPLGVRQRSNRSGQVLH